MKYLSIDIETTGLNPETCQILSIGIILEDTSKKLPFNEIPKLHLILKETSISGEAFALNMNSRLISLINDYSQLASENKKELSKSLGAIFTSKEEATWEIRNFIKQNGVIGRISIAGKNYSEFDKKFLKRLPGWEVLEFNRRVLDPAILFVDWENDDATPTLSLCKSRAGFPSDVVTHDAVEDAWDVVELLRTKY